MKNKVIKQKLIFLVETTHRWIFKEEMSDTMREFLGNLSWSFFGGITAAGIMFVVNIVAGRIFGPQEFGKYNYIISLASASVFFFLLGNNQSSIRYVSDKKYKDRKGKFLSASFFLTIIQTIIFAVIVFLLKDFIAKKFNLTVNTIYFIFILAFILSFKTLANSFVRSLEMFKKQSLAKIIDAVLVLLVFLLFFILFKNKMNYIHYAVAMMIGATFSAGYFFYLARKKFKKFSKKEIKDISNYNKFLIFGGIVGFAMGLEKVFIGKYIGLNSLGIYSAYYSSSYIVISTFGMLFLNIFWPAIIKNKENIKPIIKKLDKIFFKFFPIWFILNAGSIYIFMLFYGRQYPVTILLIALFSMTSLINIIFSIFLSFLNIDKIFYATIINSLVSAILITSIIIFKSIPAYLITQVVVYLIAIIYIRKTFLNNNFLNNRR